MIKIFLSYSHKNEDMRNELEKHFSVMKRTGLIDAWYDRRILPGEEFDSHIMENLENSQIVLLLISADFLASDYCYEKEMIRAIEKHDNKEIFVIPIILEPCDWKRTPFEKLKTLPTDGKPVSKYANMNDAYLEIVEGVREVINSKFHTIKKSSAVGNNKPVSIGEERDVSQKNRSSNLRVKKKFSDRNNDEFIEKTYAYIENYFENSMNELKQRNSHIQTKLDVIDSSQFEAIIYKDDESASECRIWLSKDGYARGSKNIKYSSSLGQNSSYNESIAVEDDGYVQFLKASGMRYGRNASEQLSMEGAAELLWSMFIERLQS